MRAVIEEARAPGTSDDRDHEQRRLAARRARADAVLPLEAGEERAVAATKTYLNSLGAVALLFARRHGDAAALGELRRCPSSSRRSSSARCEDARVDARAGSRAAPSSRAASTTARRSRSALKIRELSGLLFEAYSAADLMHGPVAAIGPGWPVIAVAPSGPALRGMVEAIDAVAERGARLLIVSDDAALLARADFPLPLLPGVPEWLSPLTAVVPGQLAALQLARLSGIDLDRPLGLSKVTLTR